MIANYVEPAAEADLALFKRALIYEKQTGGKVDEQEVRNYINRQIRHE